jgi:competence protein ComEA
MDELLEKLPSVLRDNLLAAGLGILGFGLLVYGLMSYVGFGKPSEPVTFSAEDDKVGQKEEAEEGFIVVDVAGAVTKPGVYRIKEGSRFQDAIVEAGGLSPQADSEKIAKQINLAAKLIDSAKVYVPFKGESGAESQGVGEGEGSLININTASAKELDSLPGVGSVTSEKIINSRPYGAVEELVKNKIISQRVFGQIKEKIGVF